MSHWKTELLSEIKGGRSGSSLEVFRIKEDSMVVLLSIRQYHPVSYGHEGCNKIRGDEILHPLEG